MISSGAGVWHWRMRGICLHKYPKRRRVQLTFGAAIGQWYLNPTMLSSFGFLVCVNTGGMIQWCTVSDRARCLQSASLNSLNQPVAGILINKLLEFRLAQCMLITGGLLMLTGRRADWLGIIAQWNIQTSSQSFLCPPSRCLHERKKQWGNAWIINLTQTTSSATSYRE